MFSCLFWTLFYGFVCDAGSLRFWLQKHIQSYDLAPPSSVSKLSIFLSLPEIAGRAYWRGRGWGRSQNVWLRKSLVLYKSVNDSILSARVLAHLAEDSVSDPDPDPGPWRKKRNICSPSGLNLELRKCLENSQKLNCEQLRNHVASLS
jgi:hypothetical protein